MQRRQTRDAQTTFYTVISCCWVKYVAAARQFHEQCNHCECYRSCWQEWYPIDVIKTVTPRFSSIKQALPKFEILPLLVAAVG